VISEINVVQLLDDFLDVPRGHPLGVQRQDFFVEARHAPLVLGDQLRLERAVAIARRGERQLALVALHGLLRPPVAAVGRALGRGRLVGCRRSLDGRRFGLRGRGWPAAEMHVHLGVEHPLQGGLHHQPHQAVEVLDRRGLTSHFIGELLRSRS